MMFSTPVTEFPRAFALNGEDKILALGSCFASVVGQRLKDNRMDILLNPTGTLYNPLSIFRIINMAVDVAENKASAEELASKPVFKGLDGRWHSWDAATVVSADSQKECIQNMSNAITLIANQIKSMSVMMLTFGTDRYYVLRQPIDGEQEHSAGKQEPHKETPIVANCHKMPQSLFDEKSASVDQIAGDFALMIRRVLQIRPNLKVILTVSPYRYLKYGLHGSQLSKSRLLLAVDKIQRTFGQVAYFPAYEIINDELRDYRFYAPDMVHPSPVAEDYVWEVFCNHYVGERLRLFFHEWTLIMRFRAHRPIYGDPPVEAQQSMRAREENLKRRFPEMFTPKSPENELHTA